jgi:hypothetical protein
MRHKLVPTRKKLEKAREKQKAKYNVGILSRFKANNSPLLEQLEK